MDILRTESTFLPDLPTSGQVAWKSPSNIALIKYWGKYGVQLPRNPSVSFTLQNAVTETRLSYVLKKNPSPGVSLLFRFDNQENEPFRLRQLNFLENLLPLFPFLSALELEINSKNSFPHSAGIASSASSMSALALCVCSLERILLGTLVSEKAFFQKASYTARLGSGSACRSVYPIMALWGETPGVGNAFNEYAVPFADAIHPVFRTFRDAILIAGRREKSVSSRMGHSLMEGNIYAENRYVQARRRMTVLLNALETGDLETFGEICEDEALTLHALMMTSSPSFTLLLPATLAMIERVRAFRSETGLPVFFTLDAGPNLHVLYPDHISEDVESFIRQELAPLCENNEYIADRVGGGPVPLAPA